MEHSGSEARPRHPSSRPTPSRSRADGSGVSTKAPTYKLRRFHMHCQGVLFPPPFLINDTPPPPKKRGKCVLCARYSIAIYSRSVLNRIITTPDPPRPES